MNTGFFLALTAGLLWSAGNISDKLLASRLIRSPFLMILIFSVVALIAGTGLFLLEPTMIRGGDLLIVAAAAVTYLSAAFVYYHALKTEEASRVVPLFAIGTVLIVILSAVFFDEIFNVVQYFGIGLIIAGSVLISMQRGFLSLLRSRLLGLMSLSGLFFALNAVLVKKIVENHSFVQTFAHLSVIEGLLGLVMAIILFPRARIVFKKTSVSHMVMSAITNALGIGAEFLYTMALSLWYLTLVETVASLQFAFIFIWTILLSRFFPQLLTEKMSKKIISQKSISIILIIVGIYLIS